jgi:hypothetical protein
MNFLEIYSKTTVEIDYERLYRLIRIMIYLNYVIILLLALIIAFVYMIIKLNDNKHSKTS